LSTRRFINFRRFWKILDIDYLIDDVFKLQEPLDIEKISVSSIDYYIAVTDAKKWNVCYFSNHDEVNLFETMRAAKAMPIFYGRLVHLPDGSNYQDSPNSTAPELHIQKAIALGATKLLVINTQKKTPLRIRKLYLFSKNQWYRDVFRKEYESRKNLSVTPGTSIYELFPQKPLDIGVLGNRRDNLRKTIEQGYQETKGDVQLKMRLEV